MSAWPYVLFTLGVLAVVAVDLVTAARRHRPPTVRAAATWSVAWLVLAFAFGVWLGWTRGKDDALAYLAAYLTEDSLSVDNMIVFVAVFAYFGVPPAYQHRVLFWGILGAIIMRALMIAAGVELLERYDWVTYVFGAFLVFAGLRLLLRPTVEHGRGGGGGGVLRLVARLMPVTEECRDAAFFRRIDGRIAVTPLFVTLVVIELSDAAFATDSLPAVFGVTRDPFLVYTSNLLAILGLRSLYYLIAGVLPRLRYLRFGIVAILVFVGAKMLAQNVVVVPVWLSLSVIVAAIACATAASLLIGREVPREHSRPADTAQR